ncbi:unnamed protein product [Eruca vesicaria subsp. sativa]|uniref:At2g35280-like TPR domain-containing protein n=1 Tax=Eruca vesicaria subsp. sativa TaxID=29727 RepID=A0ABC8KS83_ERUVS|nr:unnamed protein product [Eruca vesicaria subsp. sativa]
MLHKILCKVLMIGIRNFGCARIAFPGFNEVGRDDHFYRSADLIFFNDWANEVNAIRAFKVKCYRLDNPEAIYLRGMYEYFFLHLLDEGREKIHRAGERGCVLAQFVDVMMNLAFSVDCRGIVHNYPAFTRQHVDEMFQIITGWEIGHNWDYEKPPTFISVTERIDPNVPHSCWCSNLDPLMFVVSLDGSRLRWKCDHCFWNCADWNFCYAIHLTARAWPIED